MTDPSPGIIVRAEEPGDEDAIRAVHDAAFGGTDESRIVDEIRGSVDAIPGLAHVALVDEAIVGHCLCSRGWLGDDLPIVMLGPIGVLPANQRAGVGGALMRAAIDAAERAGESVIVLLGHASYYPRFGFGPARAMGIEPPRPWRNDSWMALPLSRWAATRPATAAVACYPGAFEQD